ncbi:hypothetical protein EI94DRAFT_1780209 [Lactarius quietus]|nr:hypothetical protein EI94DRAFT_1780209 [Lactarius quietus]
MTTGDDDETGKVLSSVAADRRDKGSSYLYSNSTKDNASIGNTSASGDDDASDIQDRGYLNADDDGEESQELKDNNRDNASSDTTPVVISGGPVDDDYGRPDMYSDSDKSANNTFISQYDIQLEPRHCIWTPAIKESSHSGCMTPDLTGECEPPQDAEEHVEVEQMLENLERPKITRYPDQNAGVAHSKMETENQSYEARVGEGSQENPYAPFASALDWEIAKWAKLRGPSSTAFTEFMVIDGVQERLGLTFKNTLELNKIIDTHLPGCPPFQRKEVLVGDEVCKVFYRNIIQCIRALFADPDLSPHLIFTPEWHYADEDKEERIYHDMHTGSWWWSTQVAVERNTPGATIVPVIVSTDKTQLTHFQNKSAYPVYMTIGNIQKNIRRKTLSQAYVLLGYLPTTKLELEKNKAKRRRLTTNLYHACMHCILDPLISAGRDGVFMSTAEGIVHRNHPILACFIGDYPEQVLTTCSVSGDCPVCGTTCKDLGHFDVDDVPHPRKPDEFLEALDSFWRNSAGFLRICSDICMKPVPQPLWHGLPHVNIHQSMTPDVLHQLYQGVFKHLKLWVFDACDKAVIDARCRISSLSRVSGHEHDQMCRFFLGLLIDIHLPNNLSNIRLIHSVQALLDFLYLAQYPIHSGTMLRLLTDTLSHFHANKDIFVILSNCDHFNIPKFHAMIHYVYLIKMFGTTDNFNTQYMECLHIDLIKDVYAATNHKDEGKQITTWNERKERIHHHNQHVTCHMTGGFLKPVDLVPPTLSPHRQLMMARHPSQHAVPLDRLQDTYGAPLFKVALRRFILSINNPTQTCQQLEASLWQLLPGCFNTAYINNGTGNGRGVKGYHIGRVRVVFSIPQKFHTHLFSPLVQVPLHLAYVQWHSPANLR